MLTISDPPGEVPTDKKYPVGTPVAAAHVKLASSLTLVAPFKTKSNEVVPAALRVTLSPSASKIYRLIHLMCNLQLLM